MINLDNRKPHLIGGLETNGGDPATIIESIDPYTGSVVWQGNGADRKIVDQAVSAARTAFPKWRDTPLKKRANYIKRFTEIVAKRSGELAELIARENGKALWDARIEVNSLITKFDATSEAYERRASETKREIRGLTSKTRFSPHGVLVVLGPFNFPMSMANSHIMPALYAGNTVVFKPSELTPLCGLVIASIWQEAGLPPGVLNCVCGADETGRLLTKHDDVDGVLFIGSHKVGIEIRNSLVDHPEKIVALEMGGNSPLVVWDYKKLDVAVHIALQSSIASAGQRCTAARRLIVRNDDSSFIRRLVDTFNRVIVGHFSDNPEPFYGPLIRPTAASRLMARTQELVAGGASPLVMPSISGPMMSVVSPGLLDVTNCKNDKDEEIFGPLLKLYRVNSFDEAIAEANRTKFGLAAGIICRDRSQFEKFYLSIRAGIVNWNQQLTGATTFAPFGGAKQSGNHRPAGYMSVDYCSYSAASFEVEKPSLPDTLAPGISFS